MKFTHRILLMPVLTAVMLLGVLAGVWHGTQRGVELTDRVQSEFGVFMTVSHDLETVLIRIPPALQTAMNAEDAEFVAEADSLAADYVALLESIRGWPTVPDGDLDRARARFEDYYELARRATLAMIDSGLDVPDAVFQDLIRMNREHEELVADLQQGAETIRTNLDEELRNGRTMARYLRRSLIVLIAVMIGFIFVASFGAVRAILGPVRNVRDAVEAIAHGDLHQRLEHRSDDDLGRLADAFRRMQQHLIMDIDRRERAEAALRASEERLALAFDAANDGLWDLDPQSETFYFSPRYIEMLGYEGVEIPNNLAGIRRAIHADDRSLLDATFEAHMVHGLPFDTEVRIRRRDGQYGWFQMRGKIVDRNEEGQPTRVVGTLVDIAGRKAAEEQLLERTHELEVALADLGAAQTRLVQQAKMASLGQVVAGLAHELNNPVGAMAASADLTSRARERIRGLIDEATDLTGLRDDPRLQRALSVLADSAENTVAAGRRITEQLQDLKTFTRLDEADVQSTCLHTGLDATLAVVAHELGDRITVRRDYGDLPQVMCHPGEINQVFQNLLTNAAQAIEGTGTITVGTRLDGGMAVVTVADTGAGIPADRIDGLFDVGFTSDGERVKAGWGLAMVRQIVRRHGGEVTVESTVGEGSVFTVRLPVEGAVVPG